MIKIIDWAGNVLFHGLHTDDKVDEVLDANRCQHCQHCQHCDNIYYCPHCDGTGYWGDFEVFWDDETNQENVYECINY